jgi:hypothetical protein
MRGSNKYICALYMQRQEEFTRFTSLFIMYDERGAAVI